MYGSNLWDLFNASAEKLYTSWNVHIKTTFKLPFATHRYIVYNLTDIPHLRVALQRRFIAFHDKLNMSYKPEVVHLFSLQKNDVRSVFGRNCAKICREYNTLSIDQVSREDISMPIKMRENDQWRIPFLNDLVALRDNHHGMTDIPQGDIDHMINFICCN